MEEKELQRMLGMQLLHYLEDDTQSVLTWKGNKTQLVELSCYLYYIDKVKNEYGVSVSKMEVVRRVFRRFGMSAPKSIGRYSENIRNNCNTRSQTMLMLAKYEQNHGRTLSLNKMIEKEERSQMTDQKDTSYTMKEPLLHGVYPLPGPLCT